MKKIQMVDVVSQYKRFSNKIDKAIKDVIISGNYIQGEKVKCFEQSLANYLNVNHVISCANGTDALQIAFMSLDLSPGDEVLVPTFTFVSTVEVICLLGLVPVFLDVEKNTFLLDPVLVEQSISKKTKAIIPVHLFGQCCNMHLIKQIAKHYNLFIIEDAAQSLGSRFKGGELEQSFSGTVGDVGTTSFYPSKNLGCIGDGGAIFTNNSILADKIRLIVNHGQRKKYYHETIGVNSRLDALQAVVLSIKLQYLDDFNNIRFKCASKYNDFLSSLNWIKTPELSPHSYHIFHQYSILISDEIARDQLKKQLAKNGIPTMIYYPIPIHDQEAYQKYKIHDYPVADKLSRQILALPMHTELDDSQIAFICDTIKQFVN